MKSSKTLLDVLESKHLLKQSIDQYHRVLHKNTHTISLREISLFKIEELTFEQDSPRREAFENVLSTLRIDGIVYVYLLLGEGHGVSFYMGVAKDLNYTKELELDIDDIGKHILKPSIEGNFRGSKVVEVTTYKQPLLEKIRGMKRVAKIDGVPSPHKEKENFQGVDRLVDVMMGDLFGVMILADPLNSIEMDMIESSLYIIYNKLSPLSKISIQESKGETNTEGESIAKSDSQSSGTNSSEQKQEGSNTSKGTSSTNGSNTSSSSNSYSANNSAGESKSHSTTKGDSHTTTKGTTATKNSSKTTNQGTSTSREFANKVANEWMGYIDEVLLKRVEYGRNKGMFNASIYLLADQKGTLLKLGNTMQSLFSGAEENKAPLSFEYVVNKDEIASVHQLQMPRINHLSLPENQHQYRMLLSKNNTKMASWLSVGELSVIASLPQKEVVGLSLKEEVEFGLNLKQPTTPNEDAIFLGNLVQSGKTLAIDIHLNTNDLDKHIFIAGVTGSGKTTTCQRILESAKLPFMVIEPVKTEYRVMTKTINDLMIFTLGDERIAPFRLNPFEFFPHESISSRVDMIKATIEAAFDMEAAIPQIIEASLYRCYESYGWDISTSKNLKYKDPFADGVYAFPTLSDLIEQTEEIVKLQGFDERLKNDYIGSIKARLQGLTVGAKGFMLNTPRSIDFGDLITKNVILELDEIKNGSEKSLVMGFVLININEALKAKYKAYKKEGKQFKHITLIEEAHRLLSKFSPGDSPNKKLGVESFADMLSEVRKYGESLIIVDQIPNKLTSEVLKNTNTKIVHRLFAQDDKEAIGNTMALEEEQKAFLSNLETGRVIISNANFAKPIQVQIAPLHNISTTNSNLIEDEVIRKIALGYYQKHYKRGMIIGIETEENPPSIAQIEEALSLKMNGLVTLWNKIAKKCDQNLTEELDLKAYLETHHLENRVSFVAHYLCKKLYKNDTLHTYEEKQLYLEKFLVQVIEGRTECRLEDKNMLKIRKEK